MTVEDSADKGTILIVDDTPSNLEVLFEFLTNAGFKVLVAIDGESAIQKVEYVCPDVILLDVIMPGIDGFETCRRLKNNPSTQDIPVIFMTALAQTSVVVKGFELGAVDYITKPTQQEIVLARVTTHLTIQKLRHSLQIQNLQLQKEIQHRQKAEAALQKANQQLKRLATIDGLTQIANRRRFDDYLAQSWRLSMREKWPLSLLLCDVDFFKLYNDTKGHQGGDECLYQVAQSLSRVVKRPADLVARYGGEEFAVILPNTPAEGALQVAQFIRLSIRELAIVHPQSPISQYVTLSLGVATIVPCLDSSPELLITAADQALYQAKKLGRDRAVFTPL
ncbi:MAG TPA: diguanylate cyclase response regulator [Cyanobacteria bacterium UBA11370]|nr:diguanylate cyclase response regulator [Cyanobacteria bacterium UBA11370]HBY79452.1 diguanylate cyclase response regulator [Cyanobacteria bacterium UBA11148]